MQTPPAEAACPPLDGKCATAVTLEQASAFCRRLARQHYENFTVASWLLPRRLRPHFHHIYAYCRWADDLADEGPNPTENARLLDDWRRQLIDCYAGRAVHPIFVALRHTIGEFSIPMQPFDDLLTAFRQDQRVTRYAAIDDLLGYCRCSANPVGRLVLYLGRCHDAARVALSDSVCTGLQLANFCQDVARDADHGRIYLPEECRRAAGYSDAMFARREFNAEFRRLMIAEVDRAERMLEAGWPLVELMPRELKLDIALFIAGGLGILQAIRNVDYNVWARRPRLSKRDKIAIAVRQWLQLRRGRACQ